MNLSTHRPEAILGLAITGRLDQGGRKQIVGTGHKPQKQYDVFLQSKVVRNTRGVTSS